MDRVPCLRKGPCARVASHGGRVPPCVDVAVAATLLILMLPLLAAIAIAIRLDSRGRPVFRQDRPTTEVHPYHPTWGLLLESSYRIDAPPVEKKSAAP